MATFIATAASSVPRIKDSEGVKKVMERFFWDGEVTPVIQTEQGQLRLAIHGGDWPAAWKIPEDVAKEEFEADYDKDPTEGFEQFLKEVSPFLAEPLIVQSVGFEDCRFPVAACEWRIVPGSSELEINGFKHSLEDDQPATLGSELLS
jgi:hypothetical protein